MRHRTPENVERAMVEGGFFKDRNPRLSSGDAVRCANCDRFFIMGSRALAGRDGAPRLLSWFQHGEDRRDPRRRRPTRLEACALCVERCWGGSGTGLFARWRPGARARGLLAFKNAFFCGARGD